MKIKFVVLLVILIPALLFGEEEKNDDHNTLPPGYLTRDQILDGLPLYSQRYAAYVPDPEAVQAIHDFAGPAGIKVVFGDWCTDSKKHVPAFLKVMDLADNKSLQIVYINVDRQKKEPVDLLAGLDVASVPTLIVTVGEKEAGRIVETPKISVEQDLAAILAATVH